MTNSDKNVSVTYARVDVSTYEKLWIQSTHLQVWWVQLEYIISSLSLSVSLLDKLELHENRSIFEFIVMQTKYKQR